MCSASHYLVCVFHIVLCSVMPNVDAKLTFVCTCLVVRLCVLLRRIGGGRGPILAFSVAHNLLGHYRQYTGTGSGGAHCGGSDVSPLADGTPYGWSGGSVDDCKTRCTLDPSCNAFMRRSDGACHWKSGVTEDTMDLDYTSDAMHSCYLQGQGESESATVALIAPGRYSRPTDVHLVSTAFTLRMPLPL